MARIFLAKNKMKSRQLFENRDLYRLAAFRPRVGFPANNDMLRSFWDYESVYYGRLDAQNNVVLPQQSLLAPLPSSGGKTLFTLDFVADAFRDLRKTASERMADGCLPTQNLDGSLEPYIGPFNAKRAYINTARAYDESMKKLQRSFTTVYLGDGGKFEEVMNFDDYVSAFYYFARNYIKGQYPLNLSNFSLSPSCCVLNTGLAIDIAELDAGSDPEKEDDFMNNPRMEFYKNLAQEYGFYIDKNVPWRLVANLQSPLMMPYILKRFAGYTDINSLFEHYFTTTTSQDIDLLKNYMTSFYNRLARQRPVEMPTLTIGSCTKYIPKTRQRMTLDSVKDTYDDSYWIKLYIQLRNIESSLAYDSEAEAKIIKNAQDLAKKVDIAKAIDYTDYKFKGLTNTPVSLAYKDLSTILGDGGDYSAREKEEIIKFAAQSENIIVY